MIITSVLLTNGLAVMPTSCKVWSWCLIQKDSNLSLFAATLATGWLKSQRIDKQIFVNNVVIKLSQSVLVLEHLHIIQRGSLRGNKTKHIPIPQDKMLMGIFRMHGHCRRSKCGVKVEVAASQGGCIVIAWLLWSILLSIEDYCCHCRCCVATAIVVLVVVVTWLLGLLSLFLCRLLHGVKWVEWTEKIPPLRPSYYGRCNGIGCGGYLQEPNPYSIMVYCNGKKTCKCCCRSENSDSGVHLKHASMTLGITEYHKYDPLGAQHSPDALTTKILFIHSFLLANCRS